MGKEGPCGHCGIEHTPLWRNGPPEKPVLCNACGSRWRTRGTLNDYIPKHAMREMLGSQTDEDSDDYSGSGSTSTKTTKAGTSQLVFENAPRRKRSVLDQYVLTPVERLTKQLFDYAHEQPGVFLNKSVDGDMLIDRADIAISAPLGTALGAVLLATPLEEIKPTSSESTSNVETKSTTSELAENGGDEGEPPAI